MNGDLSTQNILHFKRLWRRYADSFADVQSFLNGFKPELGANGVRQADDGTIFISTREVLPEHLLLDVDEAAAEWQCAIIHLHDQYPFDELAMELSIHDPRALIGSIMFAPNGEENPDWEMNVFMPTFCPLPINILRYMLLQWDTLKEFERQRCVEAMSGWLAATVDARRLKDNQGQSVEGDLALEVIALAEFWVLNAKLHELQTGFNPLPRLMLSIATREEEVDGHMNIFYTEWTRIYLRWCEDFTRSCVTELERQNRISSCEYVGFSDELEHTLSTNKDDIREFHVVEECKQEIQSCMIHFTEREKKVVRLDAEGLTNPQIAERLGITTQDVKNDLESLRNTARNVKSGKIRRRRKSSS